MSGAITVMSCGWYEDWYSSDRITNTNDVKDENLDVIYINEKIKRDEWHTFEVGQTRFNDEALRQAGEYRTLHS